MINLIRQVILFKFYLINHLTAGVAYILFSIFY